MSGEKIKGRAKRGNKSNTAHWDQHVVADAGSLWAFAEKYFEWKRERNYAETTLVVARGFLKLFFCWCELRGITRPEEVAIAHVDRYQRHLFRRQSERGTGRLSFRTQHQGLSNIQKYFRWLVRRGYVPFNPAADIELPRLERFRLPKSILTVEEMERLLSSVDVTTPMGIRDRAMLETLYSTGIRRSELAHLKIYDIDYERGTLTVRYGKGKKDRMIPIGGRAVSWIEKYLFEVRASCVRGLDPGALFMSFEGFDLSPQRVSDVVRKYLTAAGMEGRGCAHMFRHTMATLMHENGADIRFVARMLGHSSLVSSEIYTHVNLTRLKEIHEATHPAERRAQSLN